MVKPTISTTLGIEGLDVKGGRDILLGDSPKQFASAVIRFRAIRSLGNSASRRVREQFGRNKVTERFDYLCCGALPESAGCSQGDLNRGSVLV